MADRIQVTVPQCVMHLDGQVQIVLCGSVVDVPSAGAFRGSATKLAEPAGALVSGVFPTSVRSVRVR